MKTVQNGRFHCLLDNGTKWKQYKMEGFIVY